ncbi:MAG: AAA family ATPase, partial [Pseudorhodobacter sp.]|nr:AAA family ATPase [Pseudorhodobacter sp.]
PEALLQGALGGLTRDSYAAMFSLDDDTLEQGGDGILASKGDLGEMLFSASAGMADLGRKLETLRSQADAFHRPGGRKGPVTDAKAELTRLDTQRQTLDTQATAHKDLVLAEAQAASVWQAAQTQHQTLTQALRQAQHRLRLLPYQSRLHQLQAELAPLSHLPALPAGTAERLTQLQDTLTSVSIRREETLLAIGRADRALAALHPDPAVLTLLPRIMATEATRAAHDEAVKDLPNRRAEADLQADTITQTLTQIGHPRADPRALLLPSATITALRRLIAARSGLDTALTSATKEQAEAAATTARLTQRLTDAGAPTADTAALALLLTRLKQRDPADALTRATRAVTVAADALTQRMTALTPWAGTPDALAAYQAPTPRQVDAWLADSEALRIAATDASRKVATLRADLARAPIPATTASDLPDATAARALRERLWADHRHTLTAASAAQFETAMRQDDQITARLADLQSDARLQAAQRDALALASQTLAQAETAEAAALKAQRDHATHLAETLAPLTLQDLRHWLDAHTAALTARTALHQAERDRDTCAQALHEATQTLAQALNTAPHSYDLLYAQAQAAIDADRALSALRTQLHDAQSALTQRQTDLTAATNADHQWQTSWNTLTASTWLHTHPVQTVAPLLANLDTLDKAVLLHDSLLDRIAKMTANRDSFAADSAAIAVDLDLDPETRWTTILQRLRAAEQTEAALTRETAALTEAQQKLADLTAQDETAQAALHHLATTLATTPTDLPTVVAGAQHAVTLRAAIATCTRDLAQAGGTNDTPLPDRAMLQAEVETLTTQTDQASTILQTSFAAMTEAQRQLLAVGGDDAVARIETARANVLEDLADQARAHLARRLGILVLDKGLQRYRDSHRSAMLARASAAFETLTRGAYRSLAAQPTDAGREVLVAVARDGAAKLASELSKGTRFQLYLALRIAGYHELAKSRKPVPFLADDIMETFDDHRAAQAFGLLAGMAQVGQVIYLTHHAHLCDIARTQCPGVTVHTLTR